MAGSGSCSCASAKIGMIQPPSSSSFRSSPQSARRSAIPRRKPCAQSFAWVMLLVFEQQREMDIAGLQGLGNGIPVAHHQVEKVLELRLAREGLLISHLAAAPDLGQVLAGTDKVGTADQGRKEPVQLFEVHGAVAVEPVEGICKAVVVRIRQGSLTHGPSLVIQSELTLFSVVRIFDPVRTRSPVLRIACPAIHLTKFPKAGELGL